MTRPDRKPPHPAMADAVAAMPAATPTAAPQPHGTDLPATLRQAVAATIGAIPGCTVAAVSCRARLAVPTALANDDVEIAVDGWSPSLHALSMQWRVSLRGLDPSSPEALQATIDGLARPLANQRRRSAAAAAIGIATPIPNKLATEDATPVGHLTADRSALAILAARHGPDTLAELSRMVTSLHVSALDDAGNDVLEGDFVLVRDEGVSHHLGWTTSLATADPDSEVWMCDETVHIRDQTIPEAVALAMAGRPLAALVRLHPSLDGRTILKVSNWESEPPEIAVALVPDRVRIGDLPADAAGPARTRRTRA